MTDLPEWAKIEALKRSFPDALDEIVGHWSLGKKLDWSIRSAAVHALAEMIYKHEKPPVSRELLIWREAMAQCCFEYDEGGANNYRAGLYDEFANKEDPCHRAIRLTLEGFGEDEC